MLTFLKRQSVHVESDKWLWPHPSSCSSVPRKVLPQGLLNLCISGLLTFRLLFGVRLFGTDVWFWAWLWATEEEARLQESQSGVLQGWQTGLGWIRSSRDDSFLLQHCQAALLWLPGVGLPWLLAYMCWALQPIALGGQAPSVCLSAMFFRPQLVLSVSCNMLAFDTLCAPTLFFSLSWFSLFKLLSLLIILRLFPCQPVIWTLWPMFHFHTLWISI